MVFRDLLRSLRFHITLSHLPLHYRYAVRVDYVNRTALLPYPTSIEANQWLQIAAASYAVVSAQLWVRGKWPWNWSLHSLYLRTL